MARTLYISSSGDKWELVRKQETAQLYVKHTPNLASGGATSWVEIGDFLRRDPNSAEVGALLAVIGSLIDENDLGNAGG